MVNQDAIDDYTKNIIRMFQKANKFEIAEGCQWYAHARQLCLEVANMRGLPLSKVVGVVAALSPRLSWSHNLEAADKLIDTWLSNQKIKSNPMYGVVGFSNVLLDYKGWGFPRNKEKAIAVLDCESSDPEVIAVIVRGKAALKVNSFFWSILGSHDYVTVDGHAAGIAFGTRVVGVSLTATQYRVIAEAYLQVAEQLHLLPHQLQAITWLTYRRLYIEPFKEVAAQS